MKRGDVFDAQLNPTEGSEQAGIRPVIIVSRDAINQYSSVIVVVPVTSADNMKRSYPNNLFIQAGQGGLTADSVALGGQVRAITKMRLLRQRGSLAPDMMAQIDQILRITLDL
ncbi:MAG: type II toxin-antitoxin system PemK/MazF family toxin [Anaerolineales bacterium]|nr:type II toxin-antitoxin system PemK/MazF family toxin [Anaerolineales bacterium]